MATKSAIHEAKKSDVPKFLPAKPKPLNRTVQHGGALLEKNTLPDEEKLRLEFSDFPMRTEAYGVRAVVWERCQRAIGSLATLDESVLLEAAKAPNDFAVLSYLLGRPETAVLPLTEDPLAKARMRGIELKRELLDSEGGTKTTAEVAALLKVTPQAITKRRNEATIIAVQLGTKGYHYPAWQFGVKGIEIVLKEIRDLDGWEKISFFLNPNDALDGKRPLDALRRRQIPLEVVIQAAKAFGEAGA